MSYEFPRDPLSGPVICHRGACKAVVEPPKSARVKFLGLTPPRK